MTPGLARGPPFPSRAMKGSTVAVASLENPTVPLVVGICEIDVSSLSRVQGLKGHAVRSVHWDGDELWGWSQAGKQGGSAPEHIEGWASESEGETSELEKEVTEMTLEKSNADSMPSNTQTDNSRSNGEQAENPYVDGEDAAPFESVSVPRKEMSTKGMRHDQKPRPYYKN